jgi:hypothetical protein
MIRMLLIGYCLGILLFRSSPKKADGRLPAISGRHGSWHNMPLGTLFAPENAGEK